MLDVFHIKVQGRHEDSNCLGTLVVQKLYYLKRKSKVWDQARNHLHCCLIPRVTVNTQTCLALDLVMVSESGCFFSLTAVLENNSTNSSKSISGSSIVSHTNEEDTSLRDTEQNLQVVLKNDNLSRYLRDLIGLKIVLHFITVNQSGVW